MGRRYKVRGRPGHYVERDARGRFKRWVRVGRSVHIDKRRRVPQTREEPGYGHLTDYDR